MSIGASAQTPAAGNDAAPVTVCITRTVRAGCEAAFEQALHGLVQRSLSLPGQLGVHIMRPAPGSGSRDYGVVRKFASRAALEDFRASSPCLEWNDTAPGLTEGAGRVEELTGLESWFTPPGAAVRPLPAWRSGQAGPLPRVLLTAISIGAALMPAPGADVTGLLGRFNSPPMPGTPAFRLMRADDPWPTHQPNQWLAWNARGLPELLPRHWGKPDRLAFELGGEARWRWERFHNDAWGAVPDDDNGAWLSRYMLHGDLRLGPQFRLFGQLKSCLVDDKQAPVRPVDENRLDVHQGFGELASEWGPESAWRVRAGRQELHYGSGRLLTVREGPNVRLSFDAAAVRYAQPGFSLDLLAGAPVESDPGIFDDDWFRTERSLWGAYATLQLNGAGPGAGTALDLYYLGVRNENAAFFEGVGLELRHTLGARLFGRQGVWDWNIEAIGQFGEFTANASGRGGNLLAGAFSFDAGATFQLPWRTRIGLKSDFISGDQDSGDGDLETFNPLYPRGSYFGDIGLIGPANLLVLMPTWRTHFSPSVFLDLYGGGFWRQNTADGVYGGGGNRVRGPGGSDERFIGSQINALLGWTISRNLYLEFNYAHFFAGPFLADTGPSEDVDYAGITLAFRF